MNDQYNLLGQLTREFQRQIPWLTPAASAHMVEVAMQVAEPIITRAMLFGDPTLLGPQLMETPAPSRPGKVPTRTGTVFTAHFRDREERYRFMCLGPNGTGEYAYDAALPDDAVMRMELVLGSAIDPDSVRIELDGTT